MTADAAEYFCTVGFGLEKFAEKELLGIDATVTGILIGKIFFTTLSGSEVLLKLKTVERLFVKVHHQVSDASVLENGTANFDQFLNEINLAGKVLSSIKQWKTFVSTEIDVKYRFRVNCRCTGKFRKLLPPHSAAKATGNYITQSTGFEIDLTDYDFELFVHLNDQYITIGIPVTKRPLSDRTYLKHIAVRSTVCCALCMTVDLKPDDILLDPMCGAGTILLEAVKQFGARYAIGVDTSTEQLEKAKENLKTALGPRNDISLLRSDFTRDLFRQNHFDVIICDVPFGRKFGQKSEIKLLLTKILQQSNFVLKRGGRAAILISEELSLFVTEESSKFWQLVTENKLRLGTLSASILSFKKL